MFLGAMIMGPLGGWVDEEARRVVGRQDQAGLRDARQQLLRRHLGGRDGDRGYLASPARSSRVHRRGRATPSTTWSTTTCCRSPRSSSSRPRCSSSTTPSTTASSPRSGSSEAAEKGKSVLFLLEANPGPGLGLLLAFTLFGKGIAKASAPGAAVIQFFGGIHEIYFPYVLMKPKLILAIDRRRHDRRVPADVVFDAGLRAPAAPGSIIAVYAQTPGRATSSASPSASWGRAGDLPGRRGAPQDRPRRSDEGDLAAPPAQMEADEGQEVLGRRASSTGAAVGAGRVHSIVFACDAGMGSSAMGASVLRKKVHAAGSTTSPSSTRRSPACATTTTSWSPTRT